jgi:hypothetical protein
MIELLYNSSDVRKAIVRLFRLSRGRRVAVVAFVGKGAEACLPKPKGLELICWPKEGGTHPDVVRDLIKRGAKVRFVDSLHMKLYWSEDQGAIITSANLSNNALGSGDLKEVGIKLGPGIVDIDRILESVDDRAVTDRELKLLDKRHKRFWINNRGAIFKKEKAKTFLDWLELPFRSDWKLGSWGATGSFAEEAKRISKEDYNVSSPHQFLGAKIGDYEEDDWVLTYRENKPWEVEWLYVNYIVKIHRDEKAYDREIPRQIVQVWPLSKYPRPPFRADKKFGRAFHNAISQFSDSEKEEMDACQPPKRLLSLIKKYYV